MCKITHHVSRYDEKSVYVQIINGLNEYRGCLIMSDEEWKMYQAVLLDGRYRFQDGEIEIEFVVGFVQRAYLEGG